MHAPKHLKCKHLLSGTQPAWIRGEFTTVILISVLYTSVPHCPTFLSLMRQAHQDGVGAFWYPQRGTERRHINAHNSQQIKKELVGTEDHTNYQLFSVCYCRVYRSLITFGGRPQRYISSEWKSSFWSLSFRRAILAAPGGPRQHAAFAFKIKRSTHYITF